MSAPSHLVEKTKHTKLAWVVVLSAALFFFYEFIQMHLFNTINSELRETYQLDASEIGTFFAMYFYANALCLFPVGNLIDRYSTRKLLIFAVSICTLGTALFAWGVHYKIAALGRFLVGCGASFCFLSCIRLASRWFPPQRMAFVTGVVVTFAMLGGLVAQTPFELLIKAIGSWKIGLWLNTSLGLVILILIMCFVQDNPPDAKDSLEKENQVRSDLGLIKCIGLAFLNPQNWLGGLYTALINLPVFIIGGLWGIRYLSDVHHISAEQASYATTLFFLGVIAGCLVYGWISDRIQRRVSPMVIGAILSLLSLLALVYLPDLSLSGLIILFFIIGFVTSSQVLTYPLIAELNPPALTSTAVSVDSICIMISGFVVPWFFGWLLDFGKVHSSHTVYSASDFNRGLWVMILSCAIALVLTYFMKETFCRLQHSDTK